MLMFGIVQYIIITAIPQLGGAPLGSGLGLDPDNVGLLQLPLSLAVLVFGPVFGVMLAKRHSLNTKLLSSCHADNICLVLVSYHYSILHQSDVSRVTISIWNRGRTFARYIDQHNHFSNSKRATGISSASTSDMRIIGGAIGPVIATVIITSILVSIEVDGVLANTQALPHLILCLLLVLYWQLYLQYL